MIEHNLGLRSNYFLQQPTHTHSSCADYTHTHSYSSSYYTDGAMRFGAAAFAEPLRNMNSRAASPAAGVNVHTTAVMDAKEHSRKEDEHDFLTRMMNGAFVGLVPGIFWGTLAAAMQVEPSVGTTLKIIGKKGLICAGAGGLCVGVKLVVEKYRMKRDVMNDAAGGLTGAAFLRFSQGLVWNRRREGRAFHIVCTSLGITSLAFSNAQFSDENLQGVELRGEISQLKSDVVDRMDEIINLQEEKLMILRTMENEKKEGVKGN